MRNTGVMLSKRTVVSVLLAALFAIASVPASATISKVDDPAGGGGGFVSSGIGLNGNSLGAQWEGAQIGARAGWWLHPYYQTNVAYDSKGFLTELGFKKHAWYDVSDYPTTTSSTSGQVSEPGALALFGIGLVGLSLMRRWKQNRI